MCDFGISGYLVDSVAKTLDAGCKPYMAVSGGGGSIVGTHACDFGGRTSTLFASSLLSSDFNLLLFYFFPVQPERINPELNQKGYNVKSDVWSLGITLVRNQGGFGDWQGRKHKD